MDNELKKFCQNYEVAIVDNTKRHVRYHPPVFFSNPHQADLIRQDIVEHVTEPLYTLQIPEGRLKALVEMEKKFFKYNPHSHGQVDMFEMLMEKEREESYMRKTNQAVAKAYEQYSICLNLAGYQRKI